MSKFKRIKDHQQYKMGAKMRVAENNKQKVHGPPKKISFICEKIREG
jgi:hypothetical protein